MDLLSCKTFQIDSKRTVAIQKRIAQIACAVSLGACLSAPPASATQGTWTAAPSNTINGGPAFGLWLLTDGTVLSHGNGLNVWVKLTPDANGSYANGTWSTLAGSPWAMGGAEEHILKDGRFIETGAEYLYAEPTGYSSTNYNDVQIYDPVANTWTIGPAGLYGDIGDSGSAVLSNGTIFGSSRTTTAAQIYNPTTNAWTAAAGHSWGSGDEDAWTSLPNGGVFSLSNSGAGVYNPATNTWTQINYPSSFYPGDIGPTELLYDGRILCLGYESTAIFTPTSLTTGTWATGPAYPGSATEDAEDEYGCCEPDGKVMFATYPVGSAADQLVEFDPTTNTFSTITPPADSVGPYPVSYCVLPNGQVMVCCGGGDWLYTPAASPSDSWRPTVTSVAANSDGSYTLTGTQLSGLVNGWDEGDDMSGAENYPIVWLTNSTGKVWYCKSYDFSNMMPLSGTTAQTCQFTLPAGLAAGTYSLYVSSVGVPSKTAYSLTTASNYTIWPTPSTLSVSQGSTSTDLVKVTESGGLSSSVSFSATGLPTGVTASFSPTSSTTSTTVTFTATSSATTGTSTVTIKGTNGSKTHSETISLTVVPTDFSLSASPSSVTVSQGYTAPVTVSVVPTGAFSSSVSFSASGLPTGVTAAFSPTSSTTSSTLTFTASSTATIGSSTVTVTGAGGGKTHTLSIPLTVASSTPPSPTAFWQFENNANDSSGNGHTGTVTSGTYTTSSKVGTYALSLAGAGYMTAPSGIINTASSFTVACWAKLNNTSAYEDFMTVDGTNVSAFYLQYNAGNGKISFNRLASDSVSAASTIAAASAAPSTGTWYHVVGVYDATAQTLSLYINGTLQQTVSYTSAWNGSGSLAVGRGMFNAGATDFLNGVVDNARVYNSALTAAQVSSLYSSGG